MRNAGMGHGRQRILAKHAPLTRLCTRTGAVILRDPRCLHRGSPNQGPNPRMQLVLGFSRTGLSDGAVAQGGPTIQESEWARLGAEAKHALRDLARQEGPSSAAMGSNGFRLT